jgi:hypothetical protein
VNLEAIQGQPQDGRWPTLGGYRVDGAGPPLGDGCWPTLGGWVLAHPWGMGAGPPLEGTGWMGAGPPLGAT